MKRIACLSTLRSPLDIRLSSAGQLVEVYNTTRLVSLRHGISGLILVSDNVLLHIAEGSSTHLSKLVYALNRSDDVMDNSVIASQSIAEPVFSGWKIRVVDHLTDKGQDTVGNVARLIASDITLKSDRDEWRINQFFDLHSAIAESRSQQQRLPAEAREKLSKIDLRSGVLSLPRWPQPSQLRYSVPIMDLCTALVGKAVPYSTLRELGIFATEAELYNHLIKLYRLGVLTISDQPAEGTETRPMSNVTPLVKDPEQGRARVSRILRRFIESASQ